MKIGPKPDRLASAKARLTNSRSQVKAITWQPANNKTKLMWLVWLTLLAGLIYPLVTMNKADSVLASNSKNGGHFKAVNDPVGGGRVDILRIKAISNMASTDSWSAKHVLRSTSSCDGSTTTWGPRTNISPVHTTGYQSIKKGKHAGIYIADISGYNKNSTTPKYLCIQVRVQFAVGFDVYYISHQMPRKPVLKFAAYDWVPNDFGYWRTDIKSLKAPNNNYWQRIAAYYSNRESAGTNYEVSLKSGHNGWLGGMFTGTRFRDTWQGFYSATNPGACSNDSNDSKWSTISSAKSTTDRKTFRWLVFDTSKEDGFYCFRVQNVFGVWSYGKIPLTTTIKPPDITFYHLKDNSGDYQIQIIDKQKRDSTTNVSFSWRQIATGGQCDSRLSSGGWTTSTSIKPLTGDANIAYPVTSPKRSWMSSPIDASVGSIGRKAICARVIARAGTASQSDYAVHDLQPSPNIVFYRDSAGTNQIEYFSELSGATNFYYGIDNSVGLTGLKEVGLQSGHDGYLDQRFDSDSQYTTPNRWTPTWEYVAIDQTTKPDCKTITTGWKLLTAGGNVQTGVNQFTPSHKKAHWLCLRVESTLGDDGYGAIGPGVKQSRDIWIVVSPDNINDGADARLQFILDRYKKAGPYRYVVKNQSSGCSVKVGDKLTTGWEKSVDQSWRVEKAKPAKPPRAVSGTTSRRIVDLAEAMPWVEDKTTISYSDIDFQSITDWTTARGRGFRFCIAVDSNDDDVVDWTTSKNWGWVVPTNNPLPFRSFTPVGSNLQIDHFYNGGSNNRCYGTTTPRNNKEVSLQSGHNGRITGYKKTADQCFTGSEVSAYKNTWGWAKLTKTQKNPNDTSHRSAQASDCKTAPSSSVLTSWGTTSSNLGTNFDPTKDDFGDRSSTKRQINGQLGADNLPKGSTKTSKVYICVRVRNTLGKMTYDVYPKIHADPPLTTSCSTKNTVSTGGKYILWINGTPYTNNLQTDEFLNGLNYESWSTNAEAKANPNTSFTPNSDEEYMVRPADGEKWSASQYGGSISAGNRDNYAGLINSNLKLFNTGVSARYPKKLGRWKLTPLTVKYDVDWTATTLLASNNTSISGSTSSLGSIGSNTATLNSTNAGIIPIKWSVSIRVVGDFEAPYTKRTPTMTHRGYKTKITTPVLIDPNDPNSGYTWTGAIVTWKFGSIKGKILYDDVQGDLTTGDPRQENFDHPALSQYKYVDTEEKSSRTGVHIGTIRYEACSRVLLADAPTCSIAPRTVTGDIVNGYSIFETGQSNSFTEVTLTNANPFLIRPTTGSRYSIDHDTNSYSAYPVTGGLNNHDPIASGSSLIYTEAPTSGVVWPGPHTQTWTIKWRSDAKNKYTPPGSSDVWAGPEAKSTINCGTDKVYASTTEPLCSVNQHIFDEAYPDAYVSINLTNRSYVPLSLQLAQFKIEDSPGAGTYPAYANVNLPGTIPTGYSTTQTGWGWSRVVSKRVTSSSSYQKIGTDSGSAGSVSLIPSDLNKTNAQIRTSYSPNTLQDTYDKHNNQTGWGWTSRVDYYDGATSSWKTIGFGFGTASSQPNFTTPTTETVNRLQTVVTVAAGNNTHRQPLLGRDSLFIRSPKNQSRPQGDYGVHWKLTLQRGLESWTSDTSNSANNSHTSDAWARPRGQETVTCPVGNLQLRIRRVPFVKTFFGDISAGGTFGAGRAQDACLAGVNGAINPSGKIYGYSVASRQTIGPDVWRGASAQYALQAKHDVIGFYSSANNHPGFELSLANTSTNLSGHNFGGNFGVDRCLFNYWRPVADLIATQVDALDLATLVDEDQELYQPQTGSTTVKISQSSTPDPDLKATIYIDGDAIITDNIINNDITSNWNGINQIGLIQIIAKGNIYIDKSVTRIDASLVAYPKDATTGGHIYSCSTGTNTYTTTGSTSLASGHFADCQQQLVIRGSLVARQVHLGRIFDSVLNEPPKSGYDLTKTNGTRASEVILLGPELSLAQPATTLFDDFNYSADAILVLPPNF